MTRHQTSDSQRWQSWRQAAKQTQVIEDLRRIYTHFDQQIASQEAVCDQSGRCCNFEKFDHRLYLTGFEIVWVLSQMSLNGPQATDPQAQRQSHAVPSNAAPSNVVSLNVVPLDVMGRGIQRDSCVYQVDGLCSIHTIRPMGCRMFFCQEGADQWMGPMHEAFGDQIRKFHDKHGLAYRYMEWRAGLTEALEQAEALEQGSSIR